MLAKSAAGVETAEEAVFNDASEDFQDPTSRNEQQQQQQQQASMEYGRRQIQATDGNDLPLQSLSIADNGTDTGEGVSGKLTPMSETTSNIKSSTDPTAKKRNVTTRKALPPVVQENISPQVPTLRHKASDTNLQREAQSPAQPSNLPKLEQHRQPSTVSPTSNDPSHTFSTSARPDPLARLPPSFNPTNTVDTTVDTTIAPAVTHETLHMRHLEIVQESISRDIHVDHYYHFIQPLQVVEVNPPKHFRINSNGEKVPIAPPEGWQMPNDLSVRKAPDFIGDESRGELGAGSEAGEGDGGAGVGGGRSRVKLGWERRDYVVDADNPKGRMLSAEELEQERRQGHLVSPVGVGAGVEAGGG